MRLGLVFLVLAGCGETASGPCGNGALDPFEDCDDGNLEAGDLCSPNCTREPSCGDRIIDSPRENCDDGNQVPGDNCDETCRTETVCGDRDIEPGETCEDGNTEPSDGCSDTCQVEYKVSSDVRWQFVRAADATVHECPTGFDTVEITTQALRGDGSPAHAPVVETLPCSGGMRAKLWYVGRYRVLVRVTDSTGVPTFATIVSTIDLRGTQRDVLAQYVLDGGIARFEWQLIDEATGLPQSCADAGIDTIGIRASSASFARAHFVSCATGHGATQALPAGEYELTLSAVESAGVAIERGYTALPITITAPNGVLDLGPVDLSL